MRHGEDEGFTLIELLTVTLIIGVLAAIAVASLLSQREKAYRSAMKSDLRSVVTTETAWSTDHDVYTADVTDLATQGFRQSRDVTTHIKVTGGAYVACTRHPAVADWLVFDSTTATTSTSPVDCA